MILAVRSIPLSKETSDAWRNSGVTFVRRSRVEANDWGAVLRIVRNNGYEALLNLGNMELPDLPGVSVWNSSNTIRAVSRTSELRVTLDDDKANTEFMPPLPAKGDDYWVKRGGFGGTGVRFYTDWPGVRTWYGPDEIQKHIEGDEYRVITVGDKVVQASKKVNVEWINGRHHFDYEWCGVAGISTNGVVPLLKRAVEMVPGYVYSVLGWDIIVGDRPWIIECNTSPGVNVPTAERIVRAMNDTRN